jgi:hypothetical protein
MDMAPEVVPGSRPRTTDFDQILVELCEQFFMRKTFSGDNEKFRHDILPPFRLKAVNIIPNYAKLVYSETPQTRSCCRQLRIIRNLA